MPNAVRRHHEQFPRVLVPYKDLSVSLCSNGAGVFHTLLHDLCCIDPVVGSAHRVDLRQHGHVHIRKRCQEIVGIDASVFRKVDALIVFCGLILRSGHLHRRRSRAAGFFLPLADLHLHVRAQLVRAVVRSVHAGVGIRDDLLDVGVRVVAVDPGVCVHIALDHLLRDLALAKQPLLDLRRHLRPALGKQRSFFVQHHNRFAGLRCFFEEKTAGYGPAVLHNIGFSAKAILT